MSLFNTSISNLTGTSTFYDWFIKENDEIIAKLNLLNVSGVTSGDGILASTNTSSGLVSLSIGGTSGTIKQGLSFAGPVSFLNEVVVPNASYKITGITLGTSGYTFGSVIRLTSTGYTRARATDPDSAEVIGVLSSLQPTYSIVTISGKIDGNFTGVAGSTLSAGCVYFLSTVTGGITATEPNLIGYVSKPVIIGLGATSGLVVQYRGNYINDDNIGASGTNRIIVNIDKTTTNLSLYGFSAGNFISYGPELLTGNTFFHEVLTQTGRTAINGWFLSGSKNYLRNVSLPADQDKSKYSYEEDYIVGMIETVDESSGTYNTYQIVTHGTTTVIPKSISAYPTSKQGSWIISGLTYTIPGSGITQQLIPHPSTNNSLNGGVYHSGFVFDSGTPASWFVDLRPLTSASLINGSAVSTPSSSGSGMGLNYAWNGDFEIHQRNIAKNSSNPNNTIADVHLSDGWYKNYNNIVIGPANATNNIYREKFDLSNTDVEGNPKYYLKAKFLVNPSATLNTNDPKAQIGHFIDGIRTFNGESITVSFYAKCDSILSGYKADVYIERVYVTDPDTESETNVLLDKEIIDTITLQNSWTKYTLNHNVTGIAITDDTLGHVRIGLDFKPLILEAKRNSIPQATADAYSYLASFCVYSGTFSTNNTKHQYESFDVKLKKAQKYYYTTYTYDDDVSNVGQQDMSPDDEFLPSNSCISFTNPPSSTTVVRFPQQMLKIPIVSLYSPYIYGDNNNETMYNKSYSLSVGTQSNLQQSITQQGIPSWLDQLYTRVTCGSSFPVNTIKNQNGVLININCGCVPFDELAFHIVVDSAYTILV